MTSLAFAHATPAADEQSPEQALEAYMDGLRDGSLEKLQELFLADGQFCSVATKPTRRIDCRKFNEVLGSWVAKPDPGTSGRVIHRKDATPSMSAITYELDFAGTKYIDQLLLYRVEGRWQVVAKTTTVQ
jgi:hypothetical protein